MLLFLYFFVMSRNLAVPVSGCKITLIQHVVQVGTKRCVGYREVTNAENKGIAILSFT